MEGNSHRSEKIPIDGGDSPVISLRPFDLSDIDDFMEWATDARVTRFCTWGPYTNKEDGVNYVEEKILPHPWFRAICVENRAAGGILVTPNSGIEKCRGEIGYFLGFKWWGKGIASEAVKMAAKAVFEEWPHLERLEAMVASENKGSQRVLEKAGFLREGVLRKYLVLRGITTDFVVFSLLSHEIQ